MTRQSYETDMTDREWQILEPLIHQVLLSFREGGARRQFVWFGNNLHRISHHTHPIWYNQKEETCLLPKTGSANA